MIRTVRRALKLGLVGLGVALAWKGPALFHAYQRIETAVAALPTAGQLRAMLTMNQVVFEPSADGGVTPVCHCSLVIDAAEIPQHLKDAVVAIEDRRFYHHDGVDYLSVLRALVYALPTFSFTQGGSTITQQLVKNTLLSPARSLERKVLEAETAWRVESALDKDEILAAYLNRVNYGRVDGQPITGVEQAARTYYGRRAEDLTLFQAAQLAGMINAPSRYDPRRHPEDSLARTRLVLAAMVDAGYVTQAQADAALASGAPEAAGGLSWIETRPFANWVGRVLATQSGGIAPAAGLRVYVTFDVETQLYAERATGRLIDGLGLRDTAEAALVAMTPDGGVRALVGGLDYGRSQYDRATQSRRQPGSTFKPFLYLAAIEEGQTPDSHVLDTPLPTDAWAPRNAGAYHGRITLAEALAVSANAATARLALAIDPGTVAGVAHRLGVGSTLRPVRSLAFGTSEVTLMEMVGAYGAFATGGLRVDPYGVAAVADTTGHVLYWRGSPAALRVITPEDAAAMRRMLRGVVTGGTGREANISAAAAGKTGTTQLNRDAWFIGYTDQLVSGLWVGRDDDGPMAGVTGAVVAAAWANFNANAARYVAFDLASAD